MDCQKVLYQIMQYLPWKDVRSMECTCKLFQLIAHEVFKPLDLIIKEGVSISHMMKFIGSHYHNIQFKDLNGIITWMRHIPHGLWRVTTNGENYSDYVSWNIVKKMAPQFPGKYIFDPMSLVLLGGYDDYIVTRYFQLIKQNDVTDMWLHILLLHDCDYRIMFCRYTNNDIVNHFRIKLKEMHYHICYHVKEFRQKEAQKII